MIDFLKIQNWWSMRKTRIYTFLLRGSAGAIGKNSLIAPPFFSGNIKQMTIGDNCRIHGNSWVQCIDEYFGQTFSPKLEIGDNVHIGRFAHIIACGHMKIGNGVVIAERVYISDNLHGFEDVDKAIMPQPLKYPGPVSIEDEAWIGDGACILPHVTIGKHSVVGSNAVVTKNVPPYTVVAGTPAKIIKQYNPETKKWERQNPSEAK